MITIKQGDITTIQADAIVNPANSTGIMGGGVAGAIKRAGGQQIESEAQQQATIQIGKAVATTAGTLTPTYVIHAPTMTRPAMKITSENVSKATKAALMLASEMDIQTIAVPGMGTGVGGVDKKQAASVMMELAKEFESQFQEIIFIDRDKQLIDAFLEQLKKD